MRPNLESIREEALTRIAQMAQIIPNPVALNELRDWLNADDRHLFYFRKLGLDREKLNAQMPAIAQGGLQEFIHHAAGVPSIFPKPLLLSGPASPGAIKPDADYEAIAWTWLQRLVSSGRDKEVLENLMAWLVRHYRHHDAYHTLSCLWTWLLVTKFNHLCDGFDCGPIPAIDTLSVQQLRQLAAKEGELALSLRRSRIRHVPGWQKISGGTRGHLYAIRNDSSQCRLGPDSDLQFNLSPSRRDLRLLRGAVHLQMMLWAKWPFELRFNDLRIHTEAAVFGVTQRTEGKVSLYCVVGELEVSRVRIGKAPESLLSLHGRQRAEYDPTKWKDWKWAVHVLSIAELERLRAGEMLL